ncbi:MAG TPA: LysR family transcriptional regulator [Verrucomicrobiae bacterium]
MNIHHLELFYYVAKHGGIMNAVRHIPYGIQQPAVSSQILQLEADLGQSLFQRRPFQLTSAGEELYGFIKPFFENIGPVTEKLRGGATQLVRIAASSMVLRDHLPAVLARVRKQFPRLRFTLVEATLVQVEQGFAKQDFDLAVTVTTGKLPSGLHAMELIELPLVLLVPDDWKLKSAEDLWKQGYISETLICPPASEPLTIALRQGLAKRKVDWPTGIEVTSLELLHTYVAHGFGLGVSLRVPKGQLPKSVRMLPMEGFPVINISTVWQGTAGPVTRIMLEEIKKQAASLVGK